MRKSKASYISIMFCAVFAFNTMAQQAQDGQIFQNVDDSMIAWDAQQEKWLPIEKFWNAFAQRSGGITWGENADYPDYEKVKELDFFLVRVKQGKCLMQFHHEKWRRAQDVNRWDERFNTYGGCPYVFADNE